MSIAQWIIQPRSFFGVGGLYFGEDVPALSNGDAQSVLALGQAVITRQSTDTRGWLSGSITVGMYLRGLPTGIITLFGFAQQTLGAIPTENRVENIKGVYVLDVFIEGATHKIWFKLGTRPINRGLMLATTIPTPPPNTSTIPVHPLVTVNSSFSDGDFVAFQLRWLVSNSSSKPHVTLEGRYGEQIDFSDLLTKCRACYDYGIPALTSHEKSTQFTWNIANVTPDVDGFISVGTPTNEGLAVSSIPITTGHRFLLTSILIGGLTYAPTVNAILNEHWVSGAPLTTEHWTPPSVTPSLIDTEHWTPPSLTAACILHERWSALHTVFTEKWNTYTEHWPAGSTAETWNPPSLTVTPIHAEHWTDPILLKYEPWSPPSVGGTDYFSIAMYRTG